MAHRHKWLICTGVVLGLATALALIAAGERPSLAADGIIYVDADATSGDNNGTSWDHAYTDLQDALADAEAGDQIWVAEGTYKPTDGTDRTISFVMKNEVAIYGGFAGTETELGQHDWVANPTILSGDLLGDDEPGFLNNEENSYHVFYHPLGTNLDSTAILDGFTITGGNADSVSWPHNVGGGMLNDGSSPTLVNLTFNGNSTSRFGGGIYNFQSSPTLTNCTFSANAASMHGGGMHNDLSSPTLTNCTFSANSASMYGGGMHNDLSSPTLTNCTFSANSATYWGGGIYNTSSSPTLTNCTFSGNEATYGGGMRNNSSSPTLTNCTFSANSAAESGGGIYNYDSAPTLTNCILWGDTAGELPYEIYNDSSAPVVTYSDIQGDDPYPGTGNINADPLFVDPDTGDFHLDSDSPCIDAGTNDAPNLPPYDFEGGARILDGDGDGLPVVDMGIDETWTRLHLPLVLRAY